MLSIAIAYVTTTLQTWYAYFDQPESHCEIDNARAHPEYTLIRTPEGMELMVPPDLPAVTQPFAKSEARRLLRIIIPL